MSDSVYRASELDTATNIQAHRLLTGMAEQFNLNTRVMTARFTGGGEGYSVSIQPVDTTHIPGNPAIVTFYNDDQFGPRWIGKTGVRVPDHKVVPYVTYAAENPDAHPSTLNFNILGL